MKDISLIMLFFLLITQPSFSQDLLNTNEYESKISLNFHVPIFNKLTTSSQNFSNYYDQSGWLAYLGLQYRVSEKGFLIFELPYASGEIDQGYSYKYYDYYTKKDTLIQEKYEIKKNAVGNPFLGYKVNLDSGTSSLLMGITIPVADKKNFFVPIGLASASSIEKISSFYSKTATMKILYYFSPNFNSALRINLGLGPDIWYYTGKTSEDKAELFAIYYMRAGIETEKFALFVGLMNSTILTESQLSFSDATSNQLFINTKYRFENVSLFIGYREYVSKEPHNYDGSLQFGVSYFF